MPVSYEQSFSYGGESYNIAVDMRTDVVDGGGGRFTNVNTITITHFDGTITTEDDVTDELVFARVTQLQADEEALIDGAPDPLLDRRLIDAGYTKTIT